MARRDTMGPDRGRNTPARLRTALARRLHELAQRLEQSQDSAGTVDDAIPTTHNPQPTSQVTTQNSELGAPPAHWLRDVQARSGTGPPAHWVDYSHGEPLRVDPFDPYTPFLPSVEQDTPPEAGGPKAAGAKRSIGKLLAIKPRVESQSRPCSRYSFFSSPAPPCFASHKWLVRDKRPVIKSHLSCADCRRLPKTQTPSCDLVG